MFGVHWDAVAVAVDGAEFKYRVQYEKKGGEYWVDVGIGDFKVKRKEQRASNAESAACTTHVAYAA